MEFIIFIFMELKRCSKCGVDKYLLEFNNRKSSSDGLHYQCRECCNIDKKRYREENPDKIRESKKRYREENPDKIKEYERDYRINKVKKNKYSTIVWYYPTEPFSFVEIVKIKLRRKDKNKLNRESLTECTCLGCGLTKPISEFYKGSFTRCGECEKERIRIYRLEHPDKVKRTKKKYRENNPVKIKEGKDKWSKQNPDKVRESVRKSHKLRMNKDPFYRAVCNIRKRTSRYIKQIGVKKDSSMYKMIGCTPDEFRKYLEDRFLEGMSWDNYGLYGWHVDHIRPCTSFDLSKREEQEKCFHYTNLQPLWAIDNIKKSNKWEPPIPLSDEAH